MSAATTLSEAPPAFSSAVVRAAVRLEVVRARRLMLGAALLELERRRGDVARLADELGRLLDELEVFAFDVEVLARALAIAEGRRAEHLAEGGQS